MSFLHLLYVRHRAEEVFEDAPPAAAASTQIKCGSTIHALTGAQLREIRDVTILDLIV